MENGDFYIKYMVWIPKKVSKEDRALLENLKNSEAFKSEPSKEDKSFFDKIKGMFD